MWVAKDADNAWSDQELLLALIVNTLRQVFSAEGGEVPFVGPSWMRESGRKRLPAMPMTADELMAQLSRVRISEVGE